MPHRNVSSLPRWVIALISLIPLAGAAAGAARVVRSAADERYVQRDSFTIHQQGEAVIHLRDSLNSVSDMRDVRRMLSGLDSSDRCRRGQRDFCR